MAGHLPHHARRSDGGGRRAGGPRPGGRQPPCTTQSVATVACLLSRQGSPPADWNLRGTLLRPANKAERFDNFHTLVRKKSASNGWRSPSTLDEAMAESRSGPAQPAAPASVNRNQLTAVSFVPRLNVEVHALGRGGRVTLQRWKTVAASLVVAGTLVLLAPWTMAGCGEDKRSGARTATTGTSPSSTEATDDGLQPTPKETSSPPGIKQELFFTAAWGAVNGEFGVEFPNESTGMGPTTLAARNGYVYVPDPVNRRIQRIDPSGTVDQVIELPEGFLIEDLAVAADGTLVVVDPIVSETSLAFTPDGERAGEAPLRQAPPGSSNIPYLWLTAAGGAVYIGMVEEPGPPVWIPIYDTDGLHDPRETREQAFSDEPVDQSDGIFLRRPWRGPNEDPPTEPQFPDLVRQGEPLSWIPSGQLGVENVEAALGLEIARLDDGSFLATAVMMNEQDWPGPMRWVAWLSPLGEPQSGTGTDRPTDSLATLDGLAPNVSVDPAGSVYVLTTDDAGLRITRFFLTESSRPPGFGSKIDGLPATEDRFSAEADAFADAVAGKLAGTGLE